MNADTMNPEALTTDPKPPFGTGPEHTSLRRPFQGRMAARVAAGLARYTGVDVTIVRIAFVVLTLIGRRRHPAVPGRPAADPRRGHRPVPRRLAPRLPSAR